MVIHSTPDNRRVRRSEAALRAAMLALVGEAEYEHITVAHVLTRADVSRGTFYAHYADKDALFVASVEALIPDLVAEVHRVGALATSAMTGNGVRALFAHAREHRELYLAMLRGAAGGVPLARYVSALTDMFGAIQRAAVEAMHLKPRVPLEALAGCWVGEQLALTTWWLQDLDRMTLEELTVIRMNLMTKGSTWGYGLRPGQLKFSG